MGIPSIIEALYKNNLELKKRGKKDYKKLFKEREELVLELGSYFFSNCNLKLIRNKEVKK